jgi:hypothetical protein
LAIALAEACEAVVRGEINPGEAAPQPVGLAREEALHLRRALELGLGVEPERGAGLIEHGLVPDAAQDVRERLARALVVERAGARHHRQLEAACRVGR